MVTKRAGRREDVLKRDKMTEKEAGLQKVRMCDEGEEVTVGRSLPHTPVPELSAQTESALRKCWKAGGSAEHTKPDEQHGWAVNIHSVMLQ